MIKIIFFILFSFCAVSVQASNFINEEALADAARIIDIFGENADIFLVPLPDNESNYINKKCMITNSFLEAQIKNHAKRFEGGQSRQAIARTLDRLSLVVIKKFDITGDGEISSLEEKLLEVIVINNNSFIALFCYISEYSNVPRGRR
jgi:hypothetical protein